MISSMLGNILVSGPVLLAAKNFGAVGRRRSTVDTGQMFVWLLVAGGVIGAVCLGIYVASRAAHRRRHNSHASLFGGLCQTHQLNHGARNLLKKVAHQHGLSQPARVFTEPEWLDPAGLRGSLRSHAEEVAALRNRLFR